MAPPNSGTAQHPIQDSSTKVLDRYLLIDCFPHFQTLSTLQQACPHLRSCTHGTISLPNSSLSWAGSPFLIHPWDLKCPPLQTSSCSVTASFSFLQSTYPMWDYLFACLFNVSSSNQHLRSILSFGSLANTQPAKISAWLINRCSVTCYWTAAERCQLSVEEQQALWDAPPKAFLPSLPFAFAPHFSHLRRKEFRLP